MIIKEIVAFSLNIVILVLIFLFSADFLIFCANEVKEDSFNINILHIVFISIQYYLLIKIQNKYSEKLKTNIIYYRTKLLSLIFLSVLLLSSIIIDIGVYMTSIYMFILYFILSLIVNEMKYYIIIQLLCLLSMYFFQKFTIIEGLTIKYHMILLLT